MRQQQQLMRLAPDDENNNNNNILLRQAWHGIAHERPTNSWSLKQQQQ
jgi:hypothetical protein